MDCVIKEVKITNFKSLRDASIALKKFNVLVGPNGSGKTNLIDFFKFLKKALTETQSPYAPYLDWWDYRNIVWQRKEELPIVARLCFDLEGVEISYEVSFSGIGGAFRILHEVLEIEKTLSLEREGEILRIKYHPEFISKNKELIENNLSRFWDFLKFIGDEDSSKSDTKMQKINIKDIEVQTVKIPIETPNLLRLQIHVMPFWPRRGRPRNQIPDRMEFIGRINYRKNYLKEPIPGLIILPKKKKRETYLGDIIDKLFETIKRMIILKHPNIKEIKTASIPRREETISEDSSNLNNVLYKWFRDKGQFPEIIVTLIDQLFPNVRLSFEPTFDGRIYIKIIENGIELHPPSIPDGLYKILSILAAIELNPSLLAIDEVENSLYKEALEYVLEELKTSKFTVIVTTHSPLVVDIVTLEDLLIVEKNVEGTIFTKVNKPQKLREKLAELNVTQSESWLYGDFK